MCWTTKAAVTSPLPPTHCSSSLQRRGCSAAKRQPASRFDRNDNEKTSAAFLFPLSSFRFCCEDRALGNRDCAGFPQGQAQSAQHLQRRRTAARLRRRQARRVCQGNLVLDG